MADELSHFNARGQAHMVDVGDKAATRRRATAAGRISLQAATLDRILSGDTRKGDVLGVARIAGIMAAKRTADLVPLCHPLSLNSIEIDFLPDPSGPFLGCSATVENLGRTGVEMEALCAVQIALLTVYDMCKAVDRGMCIDQVRLLEKQGGRSGHWQRSE